MREGFKKQLLEYRKIAVEPESQEFSDTEKELQKILEQDDLLDKNKRGILPSEKSIRGDLLRTAKEFGQVLPEEKVRKLTFQLQLIKQEIMHDLVRELGEINNHDYWETAASHMKSRLVNMEDGGFVWTKKSGQKEKVTLGDIMTDSEWHRKGRIVLDPETVPSIIRKRFLVERAKVSLRQSLEQQIVVQELGDEKREKSKRIAYQKKMRTDLRRQGPSGLFAEKMVRLFLTKLQYDYPDIVTFKVEDSDAYQDVDQKLDFIIHCKLVDNTHDRAARIKTIGIQFTTNTDARFLERKERQIRKAKEGLAGSNIEDIIMVNIPYEEIEGDYDKWKNQGEPIGGPEKLWDIHQKEDIFKQVFEEIYGSDEIDEQWRAISENE